MPEYLFAYGSLRCGLAPRELSGIVKRFRLLGAGSVGGRLYDLGEFCGALLAADLTHGIVGEVFELPDDEEILRALDDYEGIVPGDAARSLFVRVKAPVTLSDQRRIECWMYVYNRETAGAPLIAGGDYLKYGE